MAWLGERRQCHCYLTYRQEYYRKAVQHKARLWGRLSEGFKVDGGRARQMEYGSAAEDTRTYQYCADDKQEAYKVGCGGSQKRKLCERYVC